MMELFVAQRDPFGDWKSLIYLAIVVVLPALNALGKKLRERFSDSDKTGESVAQGGNEARRTQRAENKRIANAAKRISSPDRRTTSTPPPPPLPKPGSRAAVEPRGRVPTASPVMDSPAETTVRPTGGSPARRIRSSDEPVRTKSHRRQADRPTKSRRRSAPPVPLEAARKPKSGAKRRPSKQTMSPTPSTDEAADDQSLAPVEQPYPEIRVAGVGRVSAAKMKQAVILSEILKPPLALRDLDEWC